MPAKERKKIENEFVKEQLEIKLYNLALSLTNLWNYWLEDVQRIPDI